MCLLCLWVCARSLKYIVICTFMNLYLCACAFLGPFGWQQPREFLLSWGAPQAKSALLHPWQKFYMRDAWEIEPAGGNNTLPKAWAQFRVGSMKWELCLWPSSHFPTFHNIPWYFSHIKRAGFSVTVSHANSQIPEMKSCICICYYCSWSDQLLTNCRDLSSLKGSACLKETCCLTVSKGKSVYTPSK